jgi:cell division septation protein DedD
MTDDPEGPVHYQISVTGRQAAVFFLVLLVSLGVAFFLGMKTGQTAYRGSDAAARVAAISDLPAPTPLSSAGVGEGKRAEAPTPEPGEKKLGFDDGPPKDAETPTPAPAKKRSVEPTRPSEPKAAASPSPAAPAAKREPPKRESKKDAGPFYVQLLATKEPESADLLAKKLKGAGGFVKPDVTTVPGKAGLFRVRIGPYTERTTAETAVRRLKTEKWNVEPSIVRAEKP